MAEIDIRVCPVESGEGDALDYRIVFKNGITETHGLNELGGDFVEGNRLRGKLSTPCSERDDPFSEGATGNGPALVRHMDTQRTLRVEANGVVRGELVPGGSMLVFERNGSITTVKDVAADIGVCPTESATGNPLNYRIKFLSDFGLTQTFGVNPGDTRIGDSLIGTLKTPCDQKSEPFNEGARGVLPALVMNTDVSRNLTIGVNGQNIGSIGPKSIREIDIVDGEVQVIEGTGANLSAEIAKCDILSISGDMDDRSVKFNEQFDITLDMTIDNQNLNAIQDTIKVMFNGNAVSSQELNLDIGVNLIEMNIAFDAPDEDQRIPVSGEVDVSADLSKSGSPPKSCGSFDVIPQQGVELVGCNLINP